MLSTAQVFAGDLSSQQRSVLERLCAVADAALCNRLREGITPEDCYDAFVCAGAWMALAALGNAQNSSGVEAFTAGNLSVRHSAGAANCLAMQAEVLMAPYLRQDGFQFQRV